MKRIFVAFLLLFSFFLVACNENGNDPNTETFTVVFDVDGGQAVSQVKIEEGKELNLSEYSTTKEGYKFNGWSTSKGGSVVTGKIKPDKNLTLFAIFEKNLVKYSVEFKGENDTVIETKQVDEGSSINLDEISASKDNYEFKGWSLTKGGNVVTGNYKPTTNTTFYAIFEEIIVNYNITFKNELGETIITKEVNENSIPSHTYSVNDTKEWKKAFVGWSLTQGGEVLSSIPKATANATYYAIVNSEKQKYKISFNVNGGSTQEDLVYDYGTEVSNLPSPTKEGYKFVGWTTDAQLSTEVSLPLSIIGDITLYAVWNEQVNLKSYLQSLLDGYKLNPYSYIPDVMKPEAKIVSQADIATDYVDFVSTNNIVVGYGEQWQMVLDTIEQSQTFFNVLTGIESITSTSVVAFNNYFDLNPDNENEFEFAEGIYTVNIEFNDSVLYYVLSYSTNVPLMGEQTIQIAMSYNIDTLEKIVRIQIGDANALRYEVTENSYKFAIKYLGVRRAYFEIEKDDEDNIEGAIFEFLTATVAGKEVTYQSSSQFLITEDYISVVGNKASGIIGFSNYINELYSSETGELLGYEVRETRSIPIYGEIRFNTLWFNLSEQSGITSIKLHEDDESKKIYINNDSSNEFKAKTVGGLNAKSASRRYDIEFRTQFVYYRDSENNLVQALIKVPMLFVQEEQLDNLEKDVKDNNSQITSFELTIEEAHIDKIKLDYSTMIDIFITNKDNVTSELIIDFIGSKYE